LTEQKEQIKNEIFGVKIKNGLFRISFSEYVIWRRCPLKFKLEIIDDLANEPQTNMYKLFGSLLGLYIEQLFAKERRPEGIGKTFMIDFEALCLENEEILKDSRQKLKYSKKLVEDFTDQGILILDVVRKKIAKNGWSNWKFVAYEHKLEVKIPNEFTSGVLDDREYLLNEEGTNSLNQQYNNGPIFKGFIDLIVEDEEGKTLIIDFKTATRPWDKFKKSDQNLKAQLKLYKYFYHLEKGIDIDNIRTMFIVLPRTQTKRYYQEIELSFGKVALNNELKKLSKFFSMVYKQKRYFPNPSIDNCKYCQWKNTKFCSNN